MVEAITAASDGVARPDAYPECNAEADSQEAAWPWHKKDPPERVLYLVEDTGLEPVTSTLPV